jgi:adenylate kinase family enzyme
MFLMNYPLLGFLFFFYLFLRQSGRVTDPVTGITYHKLYNAPPTKEILDRCTQRSTDNEESAKKRLETYHGEMDDFLKWYPEAVKVDGSKSMEEVWSIVEKEIINALKKK